MGSGYERTMKNVLKKLRFFLEKFKKEKGGLYIRRSF